MTHTLPYAVRPPGRAAYLRLGLVLVLAVGGLVGAGAAPCWACSCAALSTADKVAAADAIFVGDVYGVVGPTDTAPSEAQVSYYARVTSVHKGAVPTSVRVTSAASGASCGVEQVTPGHTYLFFATGSPGRLTASLCGGTTSDVAATTAEVERIAGPASTPSATPAPGDTTHVGTDETPRDGPPRGWVVGLALVTGLLAILALARRSRGSGPRRGAG